MKTDKSIKAITIAAINRSILDRESWLYAKVYMADELTEFVLDKDELPIFEIKSQKAKTIITTRRIIENENGKLSFVSFEEIDSIDYGDFKKQIDKPELSKFRIVNIKGDVFDFQMETGKASIGLINCLKTIYKLKRSI